jgi:hypothetical protein
VSTFPSDETTVAHRCEQVVEVAGQLFVESMAQVMEVERSSTSRRSAGFFCSLLWMAPQFTSPEAVTVSGRTSSKTTAASGRGGNELPVVPPWPGPALPLAPDGLPVVPAMALPAPSPPPTGGGAAVQAITKHAEQALATTRRNRDCSKRFIAASRGMPTIISLAGVVGSAPGSTGASAGNE